jgi:hypothetical protein
MQMASQPALHAKKCPRALSPFLHVRAGYVSKRQSVVVRRLCTRPALDETHRFIVRAESIDLFGLISTNQAGNALPDRICRGALSAEQFTEL